MDQLTKELMSHVGYEIDEMNPQKIKTLQASVTHYNAQIAKLRTEMTKSKRPERFRQRIQAIQDQIKVKKDELAAERRKR